MGGFPPLHAAAGMDQVPVKCAHYDNLATKSASNSNPCTAQCARPGLPNGWCVFLLTFPTVPTYQPASHRPLYTQVCLPIVGIYEMIYICQTIIVKPPRTSVHLRHAPATGFASSPRTVRIGFANETNEKEGHNSSSGAVGEVLWLTFKCVHHWLESPYSDRIMISTEKKVHAFLW